MASVLKELACPECDEVSKPIFEEFIDPEFAGSSTSANMRAECRACGKVSEEGRWYLPIPSEVKKYLSEDPEHDTMLKSRDDMYSNAWLVTGAVVSYLRENWNKDPQRSVGIYFLAWQNILMKLLRAMHSPEETDHWDDISGYALLVSAELKKPKIVVREAHRK